MSVLVKTLLGGFKVRLHPLRLSADRGDRGLELRCGALEYRRPITHLVALVDIDTSAIYWSEITTGKSVHPIRHATVTSCVQSPHRALHAIGIVDRGATNALSRRQC